MPAVENLHCIVRTDVVGFFWEEPEWSGGEAVSYDYELTLPDGRQEGGNLKGITSVVRWGEYPSGQETRFSVTTNYETADGSTVAGAAAELRCWVGGAQPLVITPNSVTRQYGGTDDPSYVVSGLVDGDAVGDVVSGSLARDPGADAGDYAVTFSVSGDITPRAITAISGVRVNARLTDGTTTATFDIGQVQASGVLPGELTDFQAGGLAVSGSFPAWPPGTHDVSVTYSLQDNGSFKAANYTLTASAAADTLRGVLQDASTPTPTPTPTPSTPGTCQPSGVQPLAVAVSEVPIVVSSTTADYFVLYALHELSGKTMELPVSVTRGAVGTTTLTDNLEPLPANRYKVEKYRIANPADVDGDCIDDITELADLGSKNPVNRAKAVNIKDGAVAILNHETFETLSYQGDQVQLDRHLIDLEYIKYYLFHTDTAARLSISSTRRITGHTPILPG